MSEQKPNAMELAQRMSSSMDMLRESLETEFDNPDELEAFQREICVQIAGDERTIAQKISGIDWYITQLKAAREALTDKRKQIDKVNAAIDNRVERIKDYILMVLKHIEAHTGVNEVKADGIKITYQKQGEKEPLIIDESLIPNEYKRYAVTLHGFSSTAVDNFKAQYPQADITVSSAPDKDAIRAAIKRGEEVPGASIGAQAEGIRIKVGV
jgi:hypothetical protein